MQSVNTEAEENAMHSLDALFAKLSPEQGRVLARAMQDPTARSYRARDGETMDEKDGEKPDVEKPKAQEGGGMALDGQQAAEIVASGDANRALQFLTKLLGEAAGALIGGETQAVVEPEAPVMGMKTEQAYARAQKEADARIEATQKEAIEAIVDANPHLDDKQRTVVRKQPTVAAAREIIASYPRPQATPEKPTMGLQGHPGTVKGGGAPQTALARIKSSASPRVQKIMGMTAADNDGVTYDLPGHMVYVDYVDMMAAQRARYQERTGS
jgi:hypothetical protein